MTYATRPWKPLFLAALREVPVVAYAADKAGVDRSTAYKARDGDEEFAAAWEDAMEAGVDRAEQEAFRRATDGFDRPVWHQGQLVGYERVHSDSLLSLILKGRRKKVYADRTELAGVPGQPIEIDETSRAARIAALLATGKDRADMV